MELSNIYFHSISVARIESANLSLKSCLIYNSSKPVIKVIRSNSNEVMLYNTTVKSCRRIIVIEASTWLFLNLIRCHLEGTSHFDSYWQRSVAISTQDEWETFSNISIVALKTQFINFTNAIYFPVGGDHKNKLFVNVIKCVFSWNGPHKDMWWGTGNQGIVFAGSAIHVSGGHDVTILHTVFQNNKAQIGGAFFGFQVKKLAMKNCSYLQNFAAVSGGAALLDSLSDAVIDSCNFVDNRASSLVIYEKEWYAGHRYVYIKGSGGALGLYHCSLGPSIKLYNSVFDNNTAVSLGGSILVQGNPGFFFVASSCIFVGPKRTMESPQEGTILYSYSKGSLTNVTFLSTNVNHVTSSIIYQNGESQPRTPLRILSSKVQCTIGYKLKIVGHYMWSAFTRTGFLSIHAHCQTCPNNHYSLEFGYALLGEGFGYNSYLVYSNKCFPCPFGGTCFGGSIKAKNNFWGYVLSGSSQPSLNHSVQVVFISCPAGYCCQGESCKNYNSCSEGRQGILCGKCHEELTENLISPKCIPKARCEYKRFWTIFIAGSLVYILVLLYMKEISHLITFLFGWPFFGKKRQCRKGSNEEPLTGSHQHIPEEFNVTEITAQGNMSDSSDQDSCFSSGFVKILFFFYQTEILFKVYDPGSMKNTNLILIKSILLSTFNISPEGSYFSGFWCPFIGLTPVTKILFKACLQFVLFVLIGILFTFDMAYQKLKFYICPNNSNKKSSMPFFLRLQCCILQIIVFGYSTMTSSAFSLVSCVHLQTGNRIFFFDGSIQCWQWWQVIVWILIAVWILPFCIAVFVSPRLLKQNKVGTKVFFISLACPLPFMVYLGTKHFRKKDRVSNPSPYEEVKDDRENSSSQKSELLKTLEGPYRKGTSFTNYLYWDAVLIFQRLVLIVLCVTILNPIVRLYLILISVICFLIIHILTFPFNSLGLNLTQACSLAFLCICSMLNMFHAYVYVNGTELHGWFSFLSSFFSTTETVILLFFPGTLLFLVLLSLIFRILYVSWWLLKLFCKCIVRCMFRA